MKRKFLTGLLAVLSASALAIGLAACNRADTGNPGNTGDETPPNYTPPEISTAQTLKFALNDEGSGYIVTGLEDGVTDENITVPATYNSLPVLEIGERAFGSCNTLKSVTVSEGISVIGSGAFTDCTNIPVFKFPASLTVISDSAFQNCTGLRALIFNGTSGLEEIESNAFQNCTGLVTVTIPDSVTTVGDRVFQGCTALKSVTVGNGVTTIGEETFRGCANLVNVTLGNSLKSVGEKAFTRCAKIAEIYFPDSLERVGLGALEECTGIKKLSLPFLGAEKTNVSIPEDDADTPDNHTNFGYIFGANSYKDHNKLDLSNLETLTITGDSPIGYHAFQDVGRWTNNAGTKAKGLSTIIITGNVKELGTGAFAGCYNLQTLVLPKSVTRIGRQILADTLIEKVYYCGSESDFNKISAGGAAQNSHLFGQKVNGEVLLIDPRYYYSETEPATAGHYWRYVDGVPTPWNEE